MAALLMLQARTMNYKMMRVRLEFHQGLMKPKVRVCWVSSENYRLSRKRAHEMELSLQITPPSLRRSTGFAHFLFLERASAAVHLRTPVQAT